MFNLTIDEISQLYMDSRNEVNSLSMVSMSRTMAGGCDAGFAIICAGISS